MVLSKDGEMGERGYGGVNMVLNVHRNHKAYEGRGDGGKGVWRWGERRLYTYRYTVTTTKNQ